MIKLTLFIVVGATTMGLILAFGTIVSQGSNDDRSCLLSAQAEHLCEQAKVRGCLQYIVEADDETLLTLIDCLNPTIRRGAAYTMGERRIQAAVEPLIQRLRDRDGHTRRIAARSLGKIGDSRAAPELARCLEDKDELRTVRCNAAWALGRISDQRALASLMVVANETRGQLREACLQARKSYEEIPLENAD